MQERVHIGRQHCRLNTCRYIGWIDKCYLFLNRYMYIYKYWDGSAFYTYIGAGTSVGQSARCSIGVFCCLVHKRAVCWGQCWHIQIQSHKDSSQCRWKTVSHTMKTEWESWWTYAQMMADCKDLLPIFALPIFIRNPIHNKI